MAAKTSRTLTPHEKLNIALLGDQHDDDVLCLLANFTREKVPDAEYVIMAADLLRNRPMLHRTMPEFAKHHPTLTPLARVQLAIFFGADDDEIASLLLKQTRRLRGYVQDRDEVLNDLDESLRLIGTHRPNMHQKLGVLATGVCIPA